MERSSGAAPPLHSGADSQSDRADDGLPLTIAFRAVGENVGIFELGGELDLNTIPKLESRLFQALRRHDGLILDLRRVCFIDSSGIGLLIKAHRSATEGRFLTLISSDSQVERVLTIACIDRALPVLFDRDEAIAALAPREAKPKARRAA